MNQLCRNNKLETGWMKNCAATGMAAMRMVAVAALVLLAAEYAVSQTTGQVKEQNLPVENAPTPPAAATMDSPTWSTTGTTPSTTQKPSAAVPMDSNTTSNTSAPTVTNSNAPDPAYGWPSSATNNTPDPNAPIPYDTTPQLHARPLPRNLHTMDSEIVTTVVSNPNELPEGTLLNVKLQQDITSDSSFTGTSFDATLMQSIVKNGRTVIPAGSTLRGRVVHASSANLIHGSANIMLRPDEIITPDGTHYIIHAIVVRTDEHSHTRLKGEGDIVNKPSKAHTAETFGAITGTGAVTGAIVGGPVGLAAGASVGAAISTVQWAVHKRSAALPMDSQLVFSLSEPMSLSGYQSYSGLNSTASPINQPQQQQVNVQPPLATTPY